MQDGGRREENDESQRDEDEGDRLELSPEIGHRSFLDRERDLFHRRGPLVGLEHAAGKGPSDQQSEQSSCRCHPQPGPLGGAEGEFLVTAFGSQSHHVQGKNPPRGCGPRL